MAARKLVVVMTDSESELALTTGEENIGWVVEPVNVASLAWTTRRTEASSNIRSQMAIEARPAAINQCWRSVVTSWYQVWFAKTASRLEQP